MKKTLQLRNNNNFSNKKSKIVDNKFTQYEFDHYVYFFKINFKVKNIKIY